MRKSSKVLRMLVTWLALLFRSKFFRLLSMEAICMSSLRLELEKLRHILSR